jgi:hypothetical protein
MEKIRIRDKHPGPSKLLKTVRYYVLKKASYKRSLLVPSLLTVFQAAWEMSAR